MQNLVGQAAPPFELPAADGELHRSEQYRGSWLLLVFHRHLAWLPCRDHLLQLRQRADELERSKITPLAITFEKGWIAEAYVRETKLTWPLLVDETRQLYRAYGMTDARWRDLLSPATFRAYAKLVLRGERMRRTTGDVKQRGGDVLIDPEGIVRLHHIGTDPADRPPVDAMLEAVGR